MDLIATLASPCTKTFSLVLEHQEVLKDIQTCNKKSVDKLTSTKKEMKKMKMKAEELKAQWVEEAAKLDSALVEIEALKMEVHKSQCKMASLTKKFETSNGHQKLTSKLWRRLSWNSFVQGYERILRDPNKAICVGGRYGQYWCSNGGEKAMKNYIANFYLLEEYQHFGAYWKRFIYVEVVDWMGGALPRIWCC